MATSPSPAARTHWQVPARHVMPLGQLMPASAAAPGTHSTQKPTSQKGLVAIVQSEAFAHSTQRDVVVLQTGMAMFVH